MYTNLYLWLGYRFPELKDASVAALAPSQSLKSAEELEEEDRVAQSAVSNMNTYNILINYAHGCVLETARIDSSRTTTGFGGSQSAHESDDRLCKSLKGNDM